MSILVTIFSKEFVSQIPEEYLGEYSRLKKLFIKIGNLEYHYTLNKLNIEDCANDLISSIQKSETILALANESNEELAWLTKMELREIRTKIFTFQLKLLQLLEMVDCVLYDMLINIPTTMPKSLYELMIKDTADRVKKYVSVDIERIISMIKRKDVKEAANYCKNSILDIEFTFADYSFCYVASDFALQCSRETRDLENLLNEERFNKFYQTALERGCWE